MPSDKLSTKSQVVIPAEVRRRLDLRPGDRVRFEMEADRILLTKERPLDALERLRALAGTLDVSVAEEVERSRAGWETRSEEIESLFSRESE
jgi:AbrB family looped-hinge helix DNA binding protein